jgi:hypothetical protein
LGTLPAEPIGRYEREHSGELIHLDIKKACPDQFRETSHDQSLSWRRGVNRHHGIG